MKIHFTLIVTLIILLTGNALRGQDTLRQYIWGASAAFRGSLEVPLNDNMPRFGRVLSGGVSLAIYPNREVPVGLEFSWAFGSHGQAEDKRTFRYQGKPTEIEMDFNSQMNRFMFGARFGRNSSDHVLRPFASLQTGKVSLFSSITLDDPACDECDLIERVVISDHDGWVYGAEAGVEILMLNKQRTHSLDWLFFVSGSLVRSFRDVEYANVRYLMDEVPPQSPGGSQSDAQAHEAFAGYINASSETFEYNKVAELYRAPLQLAGVNMGVVWRF